MHPQSYQETQQHQMYYSHSVNHNQYGQPVGKSQANRNPILHSMLKQKANFESSQHQLYLQHETNPKMSSAYQNSVIQPAAPALGPYNSSCGYSMPLDVTQNFYMVQLEHGAVGQSTHASFLQPPQDWHTSNSSHTTAHLAQSTPRQSQSETTQVWYMQNDSQICLNSIVMPNGEVQMLSQRRATVNLNVHNQSSHPAQALHFQQSSSQDHAQNNAAHQHCISRQGIHTEQKHHPPNMTVQQEFLERQANPNMAQAGLHRTEQQNIRLTGGLSPNGRALQPKQNVWIPNRTNGQNLMQASSPSSGRQLVNCHVANGHIARRGVTVLSPTTSPTAVSLPPHSDNLLTSPSISSSFKGLPPPYVTHLQSAPSENMSFSSGSSVPVHHHHYRVLGSSSSIPDDPNNQSAVDDSKRNEGRLNPNNGTPSHNASVQQQNSLVVSAQQRLASQKKAGLHNNHGPNLPKKTALPSKAMRHKLLRYLLSDYTSDKHDIILAQALESPKKTRSDVFFGTSSVMYSLEKVRKLMGCLELNQEKQERGNNNGQDLVHTLLDLYWGGSYQRYAMAVLEGTLENILRNAAEFDTKEDKMIFYAMKVKDLNQLMSKCPTLTNTFDCDIATEVNKSFWRNVSDEAMDIDKELADNDFFRKICGSLQDKSNRKAQERDCLNNIQAPNTTSLHENRVSNEDLHASSHLVKSDRTSLHNESCTGSTEQTKHGQHQSQGDRGQNTMPTTNNSNRQDVSRKENLEDDPSLHIQMSLVNPSRHSHQNQAPTDPQKNTAYQSAELYEGHGSKQCHGIALKGIQVPTITNSSIDNGVKTHYKSQDLDDKKGLPEESCKLSESICEHAETSEKECPNDAILSLKLTDLSFNNETPTVDSKNVDQELGSYSQEDPLSPILLIKEETDQSNLGCVDVPMLPMTITVLSVDELKALRKKIYKESDDGVHSVTASPILLDKSGGSDVESVDTCQSNKDLIGMPKQEKKITFDREEEIPTVPSIEDMFKLSESQTSRAGKNLNYHLTKSIGRETNNPLKDSRNRKEKDTQEYQQHPPKKHQHSKRSHSFMHSPASRKNSTQTAHKQAKQCGLEIHIPNSSHSGIKASSPITPSAGKRKNKSDIIKESNSLNTGMGQEAERPDASHGIKSSSPINIPPSLSLKKQRIESLGDFGNSDETTDVLVPSGQSFLKVTKESCPSKDTCADFTKAPGDQRHKQETVSLSAPLGENVLNLAETLKGPTEPLDVCKKVKRVMFTLYGSQKVNPKETNGTLRKLPPVLSVLLSPDKNSARHKIQQNWENSFVPTLIKSRRLSIPVEKSGEKNEPEKPVEHRKSSCEDKEEQKQSSGKEAHLKHKKPTRHRSFSLGELRREAERKCERSKKSPQEKQIMGLHILKLYKRSHVKV